MPSRRRMITTALAATVLPAPTWAAAGAPTHLAAARRPGGAHDLCGLRADGTLAFALPLPARGHAAAAHPDRAEAVAFARRPGTFAILLDCATGRIVRRMQAPEGRHFYGHGVFSRDGRTLFTTENDITSGDGRIGIWDAAAGYRRVGEIPSNGIGPHEIIRLPETDTLVIANGGIHTHPDSGRDKLNLETMRPNLTVLDVHGGVQDTAELPAALHMNSLRHIAAFHDGRVACAFQWQGDPYDSPSIAGLYTPGAGIALLDMPEVTLRGSRGYAGSVAVLGTHHMGITFPRGGRLLVADLASHAVKTLRRADACGIARAGQGGLATDGLGGVHRIDRHGFSLLARHRRSFDNHLIAIR
ncbi:DUF1513 domain-containing protein [Roseobacter sp. YSTF-M11]|uniref:DUF1513 domain-containing protein n=1 Tax=Roseobacter insulae TaxID=2859783 RepID=A0A9X1K3W3_9RHOB|nr:DUF1513 domain-containing protein [Roseobacter insulae]MBW4709948.1 DUF1513 domain-containing protein [Roseobacter insulae]